jgi:hypothetical protein
MGVLLAILNWLSSSAFGAIANGVVSVLNKKTDAEITRIGAVKEADIAQIQAATAALHEQAALATLRWGWWGTRYMMMAAALPPIIHSGAVYLDSTFKLGWAISRAPGVYEGQEIQIIATIVGILSVQTIAGGLASRIGTRR